MGANQLSAVILQFRRPAKPAPDWLLEQRINTAYELLMLAKTEAEQRMWFEEMKRLCAMRTPEAVKRMEAAKGLR